MWKQKKTSSNRITSKYDAGHVMIFVDIAATINLCSLLGMFIGL